MGELHSFQRYQLGKRTSRKLEIDVAFHVIHHFHRNKAFFSGFDVRNRVVKYLLLKNVSIFLPCRQASSR